PPLRPWCPRLRPRPTRPRRPRTRPRPTRPRRPPAPPPQGRHRNGQPQGERREGEGEEAEDHRHRWIRGPARGPRVRDPEHDEEAEADKRPELTKLVAARCDDDDDRLDGAGSRDTSGRRLPHPAEPLAL